MIIIPTHSIFYSMRMASIVKPALFLYECFRITIFTFVLVYTLQEMNAFPWLVLAVPAIMFPLMALFLWIDALRYRVYLPLFTAGKCIGIFFMLVWLIIARQDTIIWYTAGDNFIIGIFLMGASGDLFALAAVLFLFRDTQKLTNKPATVDTQITEEEQCE